jgi:Ni/Fe-hydrogenase b-type cytochrome subunit
MAKVENTITAPQKRHSLMTRIWHWINAVAVFVMLMSGLTISNAHPRLYWGQFGTWDDTPWLILPRFPGWMTLPTRYNLGLAREWHFAFAWVLAFGLLAYLMTMLFRRKLRIRLHIALSEVNPSSLLRDIVSHLRGHFDHGDGQYNILQKLSYAGVLFGLLPLLVFTGMTLSPGMNAAWPWLLDLFGGRPSARSLHFIAATLIGLFIFVHLIMVVVAGPVREVRSMITGNWEPKR